MTPVHTQAHQPKHWKAKPGLNSQHNQHPEPLPAVGTQTGGLETPRAPLQHSFPNQGSLRIPSSRLRAAETPPQSNPDTRGPPQLLLISPKTPRDHRLTAERLHAESSAATQHPRAGGHREPGRGHREPARAEQPRGSSNALWGRAEGRGWVGQGGAGRCYSVGGVPTPVTPSRSVYSSFFVSARGAGGTIPVPPSLGMLH